MKKYTKSAFTLVELIVVITILAILATVAFISFGGQTGKAKNSKVTSDLSSIASKANLLSLDDPKVIKELADTGAAAHTSNTVKDDGSLKGAGVALSGSTNYQVGIVNFFKLKEKKENFQDTRDPKNPKDYVYASVTTPDVNVFNVGGQTEAADGTKTAIIKGTYYQASSTDEISLISATGSSNDTGVANNSTNTIY